MAHVLVLLEGRENWTKLFLKDLGERRYPFKMANGQTSYMQPNLREVRLFDITVPEGDIDYLLRDLAPFAMLKKGSGASISKDKAEYMTKGLRVAMGLKPFKKQPDILWKDTVEISPLFGRLISIALKPSLNSFVSKIISKVKEEPAKIPMFGKLFSITGKSKWISYVDQKTSWFTNKAKNKKEAIWDKPIRATPYIGKPLDMIFQVLRKEEMVNYDNNEKVRKQWINVLPIGWAKDEKTKDLSMKSLPEGGELL